MLTIIGPRFPFTVVREDDAPALSDIFLRWIALVFISVNFYLSMKTYLEFGEYFCFLDKLVFHYNNTSRGQCLEKNMHSPATRIRRFFISFH